MRRILFNADAVMATGFARATHKICEVLRHSCDLHVLGINYWGDPHPYPYPIYPANLGNLGDSFGHWRVGELLQQLRPDALVVQNDPWNVADLVKRFAKTLPVIAFMPVDGKNCQGAALNGLAMAIFYTQFALEEARKGGYTGPACVVGLGVDRAIYKPMSKEEARAQVLPPGAIPDGAFIVGNVNRNQPRKRIDLTIAYFAEWIKTRGISDAYLYLHMAPTGDKGWNVKQLCRYYGIANRLITTKPTKLGIGVSEEYLATIYSTFNLQVNTGTGEGFGLTTLEGSACAIPQAVGKWSALGELARAAIQIPCTSTAATINDINVIGGVPDREQFIAAMDRVYRDKAYRDELTRASYEWACEPQFEWTDVGFAFGEALDQALQQGAEAWAS
jgi:glycosyltransferase involved in cell wall biosynthesis